VGLSARGSRQLGDAVEKIEDPDELLQVRFQARKVQLKAVIVGVLMTVFVMFIP
jgi:N-acetylmuramic acid 6-phosphate (MurNAc-6-P) etherase